MSDRRQRGVHPELLSCCFFGVSFSDVRVNMGVYVRVCLCVCVCVRVYIRVCVCVCEREHVCCMILGCLLVPTVQG